MIDWALIIVGPVLVLVTWWVRMRPVVVSVRNADHRRWLISVSMRETVVSRRKCVPLVFDDEARYHAGRGHWERTGKPCSHRVNRAGDWAVATELRAMNCRMRVELFRRNREREVKRLMAELEESDG